MDRHTFVRAASCGALAISLATAAASAGQEPAAVPAADSPALVQTPETGGTGDLLTAGAEVTVSSEIDGDLAAAGRDVSISGPVAGYVMSAGRNVSIEGPVGNDLWAAGETVDLSSHVGNNVMAAGRRVRVEPDAAIGHDARLAGNHVQMTGRVDGDLEIGAAVAEIGGEVGGDVRAHARRVELLPNAVIRGDLVVSSPEPPTIPAQAQVLGTVRHEPSDGGGSPWTAWPWFWLWTFASMMIVGAAMLVVSPTWAARVAATLRRRTGGSIVAGVLWFVVMPVIVALLLFTIVGIPLAVLLLAAWLIVVILSAVFVAYSVGGWLIDRRQTSTASPWLRLAIGVLVVSLGISLPFVGWLVAALVGLFGAGALVLERRSASVALG